VRLSPVCFGLSRSPFAASVLIAESSAARGSRCFNGHDPRELGNRSAWSMNWDGFTNTARTPLAACAAACASASSSDATPVASRKIPVMPPTISSSSMLRPSSFIAVATACTSAGVAGPSGSQPDP
jgi:hypothetical protein